jgi:hypothetical protein
MAAATHWRRAYPNPDSSPRLLGVPMTYPRYKNAVVLLFAAALASSALSLARAEEAAPLAIALNDHRFVPGELAAPANKPLVIVVTNEDPTPAEFESKTLRVEKVVAGGAKISVRIRPLGPGRYRFFDDYHEDTTEGFLVVK